VEQQTNSDLLFQFLKLIQLNLNTKLGFPLDIPSDLWHIIYNRRKELAAEFRWHPQLKQKVRRQMEKWTRNGTRPAVGIHVRRKDYEKHLNRIFGPSKLAGPDYFRRAMDHFRVRYNSPVFLVVSNDMAWCRQHLKGDDVIFAGENNFF
jgi:galactoside 2-L-fucosyltransferase 1/2